MIPARESDLRILFKPIENCGEGGCHARMWFPTTPVKGKIDVVLMFHGGGFGAGNDDDVPAAEVDYLLSKGVVVVSSQYRLIPHVKYPDIIEDLCDAYAWVWSDLAGHVPGAAGIQGVALEGWSAGATSSCMAPSYIAKRGLPKPTAVNVHYGWFDYNQGFTLDSNPLAGMPVDPEKLYSGAAYNLQDLLDGPACPGVSHSENNTNPPTPRMLWLVDIMFKNELAINLTPGGKAPIPDEYNPIKLVTPDFPPTFVMIATKDQLISPKQSHEFIEVLKQNGVPHASAEADMMHGQSEIAPPEVKEDYERWFKEAIRPGLDYVLARFADGKAAA